LDPNRAAIFFNHSTSSLLYSDNNLGRMTKNLLEKILVSTGSRPKEVVVALCGLFSQSALGLVKFNREEIGKKITPKEYKMIRKKVSAIAQQETEAEVSNAFGKQVKRLSLINSQITQVKVDDFLISDPIGHKGKSVQLSFSNSFAPEDLIKRLEKVFKKERLNLLTITDFSQALLSFAGPEVKGLKDYILLVEAEESYDISIVFNNQIISTRTAPLGPRLLEKNPDWLLVSLEEALSSFEGIKTFPSAFVIFPFSPKLEEILADYQWHKSLPFQSKPGIFKIDIEIEEIFAGVKDALG